MSFRYVEFEVPLGHLVERIWLRANKNLDLKRNFRSTFQELFTCRWWLESCEWKRGQKAKDLNLEIINTKVQKSLKWSKKEETNQEKYKGKEKLK